MPQTTPNFAPGATAGASPPRAASPAAGGSQHVCPFCGTLNDKPGKACSRCTLEDTAHTRLATKQRIGPWYVLQTRNPAAPGMKFVTLASLVRKGLVTPRSIVRGPTTHQLWRWAQNVKGLSREFGTCYSCGKSVDRAAGVCPHCNRGQGLPADPDALLDVAPIAAAKAPDEPMPAPTPAISQPTITQPVTSASAAPVHEYTDDIIISALGQGPIDAAVPPEPALPDPLATLRPARQPPTPDLLSPVDLAKAFHLGYDRPPPQRKRVGFGAKLLIVLLLLGCGAGAILYARPSVAHEVLNWLKQFTQSDQTPTPSPAPVKLESPEPRPKAASALELIREAQLASAESAPATPVTRTPAAVAAALAADLTAPNSSEAESKALWITGLDAEARRDFSAAIKAYEAVQSLPKDAWPKGLETRLRAARQGLKGGLR